MILKEIAKQVPGAVTLVRSIRREWQRPRTMAAKQRAYWERRKGYLYYQEVLRLARQHASNARSVLDVGSMNSPFILQFDWIPDKVSLDLYRAGRLPGVRCVQADFLSYTPEGRFDLVLCLQVLEHLHDPAPFARRLLATGRRVIVSVPYRWPRGMTPFHVQDPVDEGMLRDWLGRPWDDHAMPRDQDGLERLIVVLRGEPTA